MKKEPSEGSFSWIGERVSVLQGRRAGKSGERPREVAGIEKTQHMRDLRDGEFVSSEQRLAEFDFPLHDKSVQRDAARIADEFVQIILMVIKMFGDHLGKASMLRRRGKG